MTTMTWIVVAILRTLTWAPSHSEAQQLLIETHEQMCTQWNLDGGSTEHKEELPKVDFNKESLVAIFAGTKPTPGYVVVIKSIEYSQEDKTLRVVYAVTTPDPKAMHEDAISHPYCVAVIKKYEVAKTVFIDQDSPEGKELEKGAAK